MKYFLTTILFCSFLCAAQSQTEDLTRDQLTSDLNFLHDQLKMYHPSLYAYSSPEEVDAWFAAKIEGLEAETEFEAAYEIMASVVEVLKDGHAYVYPYQEHMDYFYTGDLFPLELFLEGEDLIVVRDFTKAKEVPIGAKITAINGASVEQMRNRIAGNIVRDGDNYAYPDFLFYEFFPAYHSYFYGYNINFVVEYETKDGVEDASTIYGRSRDEMKLKREQANSDPNFKKAIYLNVDKKNDLATLTIKSFSNSMLKSDYGQNFKKEIKNIFAQLSESNISNLAIDLRGNQGGELSNGIFLLQHFMKDAFQTVNAFKVVKWNEKTKARRLVEKNNKWSKDFKPFKKNHFAGDVFLFTDGGSFSCSSIVANTFEENKRGKILGQMTGGSAYLLNGGPNKVITLPNSRVSFTIPRTQYILRENLSEFGKGVIPDIEVQDRASRIIEGKDPCVEQLKMILTKEK